MEHKAGLMLNSLRSSITSSSLSFWVCPSRCVVTLFTEPRTELTPYSWSESTLEVSESPCFVFPCSLVAMLTFSVVLAQPSGNSHLVSDLV